MGRETYMTAMLILREGWAAILIVDCKSSKMMRELKVEVD